MNFLKPDSFSNLQYADDVSVRRNPRLRNLFSGSSFRFLPSVEMTILIYLMIVVSLIPKSLTAQKKSSSQSNKWSIEFSLTSAYDNNILKYSDKYIERFKYREDEGRFHINRYDDLSMDYTIKLSFTDQFIKNLRTIISASAVYKAYSYNTTKSWSSFDLGLQQYISSKTTFMFSYSHLPEFYVAHFRDDDWISLYGYTTETFQPHSFSKDEYALWVQHNILTSTKVRAYFSFMKYYYNEHYTEYDSDNIMYGLRVFHDLSKIVSADAGYRYIKSIAKGFDESFESKENSDDIDATYFEHIFFGGVDFRLPKLFNLNNTIGISGQYSKRIYETDNFGELDPLHAGRSDNNYRVNVNYDIDILNNISAGLFYTWMLRDTNTEFEPNNEYVSDEKDYNQSQVGLSFKYRIQF